MNALALDPIANSPGFFKAQKVRGGAWLPARFWIALQLDPDTEERIGDDLFFAEIGSEQIDAFNPPGWPYAWRQISEEEWRFMRDDFEWAKKHQPAGPLANAHLPARATEREFF